MKRNITILLLLSALTALAQNYFPSTNYTTTNFIAGSGYGGGTVSGSIFTNKADFNSWRNGTWVFGFTGLNTDTVHSVTVYFADPVDTYGTNKFLNVTNHYFSVTANGTNEAIGYYTVSNYPFGYQLPARYDCAVTNNLTNVFLWFTTKGYTADK